MGSDVDVSDNSLDGWKSSKERLETDAKYRAGPMIHLRCDGHRN